MSKSIIPTSRLRLLPPTAAVYRRYITHTASHMRHALGGVGYIIIVGHHGLPSLQPLRIYAGGIVRRVLIDRYGAEMSVRLRRYAALERCARRTNSLRCALLALEAERRLETILLL